MPISELIGSADSAAVLPGVFVKFLLALVLGGVVGLERERKGRSAGLRTHVLVCLGATLAVIVSDLLGRGHTLDNARIAAGIITGIGFLGAGTIITVGNTHRGLTTAAMVWFVAALGIAIGAGYYLVATMATGFALLAVLCLEWMVSFVLPHEQVSLSVRMPGGPGQVDAIEAAIAGEGLRVFASRVRYARDRSFTDMTFEVTAKERLEVEKLTRVIEDRFPLAERIELER